MNSNEPGVKKTEILLLVALALVAMTLITVVVIPSLRERVKGLFESSQRVVVTKVEGKLTPQGPQVTVLKIKNGYAMSLEVYSQEADGSTALMSKIPLYEARDGHLLVQGNATNLALMDVDRDGSLEIVSPTYDEQMVPRLNIYRFNPATKSFDRVTAPQGFAP